MDKIGLTNPLQWSLAFMSNIKKKIVIIVRRLIVNYVNFECYILKRLVMKNMHKQLEIEVCTFKIKITK